MSTDLRLEFAVLEDVFDARSISECVGNPESWEVLATKRSNGLMNPLAGDWMHSWFG